MKKKTAVRRNVDLEKAIQKVGGTLQAAAMMRVSQQTVRSWLKTGAIRLAKAAMLLSRATGTPVEKLIGLD